MLFNSWIFAAFFLIVLLLYVRVNLPAQNWLLLVSSYVFYGYWDWRFLSLIFLSTIIDYCAAIGIETAQHSRTRRAVLGISMIANLGLLGFFKYYGFFAAEFMALLNSLGIEASLPSLRIILPVGISFYTFQTMSYTIDVYRGQIRASRNLRDFALFVCFFPQLVAGPVERTQDLLPQITRPRVRNPQAFSEGLYYIMTGLFRKVVVADNMARLANTIFATPSSELTGIEALVGVYAFAFQIYGDFSGYSAMAQGIARWLGFELMTNFRMPYFAVSPSDFWRRWHISLSQWLRDYLYIFCLGGNRGGRWKTCRNLLLTMILGGLWHGAGWTFLVWGLFHGILLVAGRILSPPAVASGHSSGVLDWTRTGLSRLVMFHLVCVGWLFFRADSVQQAADLVWLICSNAEVTQFAASGLAMMAFFVGPLLLFEYFLEKHGRLLALVDAHWFVRGAVYSYCTLMLLFFLPTLQHDFIYFQF